MIPLCVPSLKGNELRYVSECIQTEWISSAGSFVDRFEKEVGNYLGSPFSIACINGTAALHISLLLSGVGAEDEVIIPTLTFIAPVNAVHYLGAYPVFMDCDDHLNLDAEKLERFLSEECLMTSAGLINKLTRRRIRAILPVHVYGNPCDLESINRLADQFQLALIEDSTESLGSFYKNWNGEKRYTGTLGDFGSLSFNGNKLITTGGGGMIFTSDQKLAERARYLTTQAKDDAVRFIHHEVGFNYRLTNIQAAIGCAQLERVNEFIEIKRKNFSIYRECLLDTEGLSWIEEPTYGYSNRWHYTLVVNEKKFHQSAEDISKRLAQNKIETRPIWELNHRQKPYLNSQSYKVEKAIEYHQNSLNLPCSVSLSPSLIPEICELIKAKK